MRYIFQFLLLNFLLCACTYGSAEKASIRLVLDWLPNPNHAPLIVAEALHYFDEAGISVELITPSDPNDPPKLVATHQADIAITYQPQFMHQVQAGLEIIWIGSLIDQPLNCLVTLKENKIYSIRDLKNKKIGTSSSSFAKILLNTMLQQAQLSTESVEIIQVKYNLIQALLTKRLDAVTGMMRNIEIPELVAKGYPVRAFFPENYGIPSYHELIFIVPKNQQNNSKYHKFFLALKRATAYLKANPEASWALFAKRYPEGNHAINHSIWLNTIPYFAADPTDLNQTKIELFTQYMHQHQLISIFPKFNDYVFQLKENVQ